MRRPDTVYETKQAERHHTAQLPCHASCCARSVKRFRAGLLALLIAAAQATLLAGQPRQAAPRQAPPPPPQQLPAAAEDLESHKARHELSVDTPEWTTQLDQLVMAAVRLPVAAALACVLALRPRRRGTPP